MVARVAIICATFVVIVTIAIIAGVYLARRQERVHAREHGLPLKGDLNRSEEQELLSMLSQAETIFRGLGQNISSGLEDIEILRANTKIDVGRWLARYNTMKEKIGT